MILPKSGVMSQNYQPLNEKLILYATDLSSYSAKVRSYLLKKNIAFEERIPSSKTYKNLIIPRTGGKFIPVIQKPNNTLIQDSSTIIESLEKSHPQHSIYPTTPKQKLAALLLEVYADEWLQIPAMHFRWNYPKSNHEFLIQEYGKILKPNWPKLVQHGAAKKDIKKYEKKLEALGINTQTIPKIEKSFMQLLLLLNNYFKKNKYLFGSRPSIADFSLFGPMFAFFFRDPFAGKIMKLKAPYVNIWINRMSSKRSSIGGFFSEDNIPKTVNKILHNMSLEQIPVVMETARQLDKWDAKSNYRDLPRTLGTHRFNLHGVVSKRAIYSYLLWMWQKPHQFYQSLNDDVKSRLNPWLLEIGMLGALNKPINTRLKKINSHLLIAAK